MVQKATKSMNQPIDSMEQIETHDGPGLYDEMCPLMTMVRMTASEWPASLHRAQRPETLASSCGASSLACSHSLDTP